MTTEPRENDYVATAAAQKRLNEVLVVALAHMTEAEVEQLADALLRSATIEYKSRAKQVVISLDLPDKAVIGAARDQLAENAATASEEAASVMPVQPQGTPEPETVQAPPQPHITPYQPKQFAEPDYEDVHYD